MHLADKQETCRGELCVFEDINDRLCPEARGVVDAMTPDPKLSRQHAAQAYKEMADWLMDNATWALASHCPRKSHDDQCPVTGPLPGRPKASAGAYRWNYLQRLVDGW